MREEVKIPYRNIPDLFMWRAKETPNKIAYTYKSGGSWNSITWSEFFNRSKNIASGLIELGFKRGERAAIYSYNRLEWIITDIGIMLAGGVSIPIYHSLPFNQSSYIINDSDSVFVFAENPDIIREMSEKMKEIPLVNKIISYDESVKENGSIMKFSTLEKIGKDNLSKNEKIIEQNINTIKLDDLATIVYTSGTTGVPKGVIQPHINHLSTVEMLYDIRDIVGDDTVLLFLPLAHSFARAVEFVHPKFGVNMAIAESIDKVVDNLAEVSPTVLPSVPRVFEKVYSKVKSEAQASPIKAKIFNWAIKVGKQYNELKKNGEAIPFGLSLKHKIAHKLVFSKLHKRLGGRMRFFISGGAPLSKEIAEFFWACGLLILEGYGLTETAPAISINTTKEFKFGTVGKPLKWVEVKIAEDGEILARGPNIMKGYWKKPKETEEVLEKDGWFHTGDIGEFDKDGFLKITDRKKELIKTSGGKYVAPAPIENSIKSKLPLISQAVVIGDLRPYCVALVTLNKEEVIKWGELKGIGSDYQKIIDSTQLRSEIQKVIDEVNSNLASFEKIKYFDIIPNDFTVEEGTLTPTLKVKRKAVMQKYKDVIDKMYEKKKED
ncbi:MAG: long-chain fatty acid--CoA ligase [bacterium]|nr:long-chain fatty acid--CoA ligase [bacterium]